MKTKVLVIDDEKHIVELLKFNLETMDYEVHYSYDGFDGFIKAKEIMPDLILLDWMLPNISGIDLLKKIRSDKDLKNIPVIMLTAKNIENDKVEGLDAGADDYITKPFSPKEVVLRVKLNLKKNIILNSIKEEPESTKLEFGPFEIDEDKVEVKKNGKTLELKAKEFKMFLYMARHLEQIISKEKFCDEVWGDDFIGYDNTIMVHIRRLREKIEDNPSKPKYIKNIKGLGYKLTLKED